MSLEVKTPHLDAMKTAGSLRADIEARQQKEKDQRAARERAEALKKAVPSWVKDNLGLKGRDAQQARKEVRAFIKKEQRLPTVSELNYALPDDVELPKPKVTQEGGASEDYPFKLQSLLEETSLKVGVSYESRLYKSLTPNDKQAITGLLTSTNPEKTDPGWFAVSSGTLIWLEIVFSNTGAVTSATIEHGTSFDLTKSWDTNAYVEDSGGTEPTHKYSRKLIGYITSSDGSLKVNQVMRSDQVLRNVCIDGKPAKYPFAHEGGYPL